MAGTPPPIQISEGILRTRDLVELYYQGRMVVQVLENQFDPGVNVPVVLFTADARRIRYEINFTLRNLGTQAEFRIGDPDRGFVTTGALYSLSLTDNVSLARSFREDMEGVCLGLGFVCAINPVVVSVRQIILSPLPVDELP